MIDVARGKRDLGEVLTTSEAAALLKVSEQTLYNWRRSGVGPAFSRAGRVVRYERAAIMNWKGNNK